MRLAEKFFAMLSCLSFFSDTPSTAPTFVRSGFFCLVDSNGDRAPTCTGPELSSANIDLFADLYPTNAYSDGSSLNPQKTIFSQLIAQSTSETANQMMPKSQLDELKLQVTPNILNWHRTYKIIAFAGSLGEGQVYVPDRDVIYKAREIGSEADEEGVEVLGSLFLPPDAYGGDKLVSQIDWMLDEKSQVPQQLALLAKTYGFHGYFINGESNEAQNRKPEFGLFVERLKKAGNDLNYPLHVEWYVVGSADVEDMVVRSDNTKVTGSSFIDHFILSSFYQLWMALTEEQKKSYGAYNIEYGAYDADEFKNVIQNYSKGASVSYFDFNALEDPEGKLLLKDEKTQDDNLRKLWDGVDSVFEARSFSYKLPFYSSFNTGKGKDFFINGQSMGYDHWNSLGIQSPLPDLVKMTEETSFDYDVVYNGGSSLLIDFKKHFKNSFEKFFCSCALGLRQNKPVTLFQDMNLDLQGKAVEAGLVYSFEAPSHEYRRNDTSPQLCLNADENCCFDLSSNSADDPTWKSLKLSINGKASQCQIDTLQDVTLMYNESLSPVQMHLGEIYFVPVEDEEFLKTEAITVALKETEGGALVTWTPDPQALFYDVYWNKKFLAETPHLSYWIQGDGVTLEELSVLPVYPGNHSRPVETLPMAIVLEGTKKEEGNE